MGRDDSYSIAYPYRAEPKLGLELIRDITLADTGADDFYRSLSLYDRLMFLLAVIKRWLREKGILTDPHPDPMRVIVNPVGDVPILGQLVGFGFEIGRTIRGDTDVTIENQYGSIPFLQQSGEFAGAAVKYWPLTLVVLGALGIVYALGQFSPFLRFFSQAKARGVV